MLLNPLRSTLLVSTLCFQMAACSPVVDKDAQAVAQAIEAIKAERPGAEHVTLANVRHGRLNREIHHVCGTVVVDGFPPEPFLAVLTEDNAPGSHAVFNDPELASALGRDYFEKGNLRYCDSAAARRWERPASESPPAPPPSSLMPGEIPLNLH